MKSAKLALLVVATAIAPLACDREPAGEPAHITQADLGKAVDKLSDATDVVRELNAKNEIPLAQRTRARCILIVPKLVSGALLVGGQHGDGVVTCRTDHGWSGPAFIKMTGPTIGLQAGGSSANLIVLVMTDSAVSKLFRMDFQLGADASVAAGPVGEGTKASADVQGAEFLTYSEAKGLFAGVSVSGLVVKQNLVYQVALYGSGAEAKAILDGSLLAPKESAGFLANIKVAFP